ncbi:DUF4920 domain-containing protein [Glaciecola siphonariae]|uniref:DUF4920 domain-containing protein n=1 Tax=Glaciecola siphonariae TaxID=521012 RepID=A0ABV9M0B4_9ALTE
MKTLLLTLLALIGISSAYNLHAKTIRLSEPVVKDEVSETFGLPTDAKLPVISIKQLADAPADLVGKKFQIELPITKVCQQKGCFFIAQAGQQVYRVSFKDYGFFIPTDSGGKTVLLNAQLVKKSISAKQAAHFNSDLKSSADSIRAGLAYELVAYSVKIPLEQG